MAIGCSSSSETPGTGQPAFTGWDGGPNNGGGGIGSGTGGYGGSGSLPPLPNCGNGVVDPGEDCEGTAAPNGMTCSSATMNSMPIGTLKCTGCRLDTSGCTSNGNVLGTGGGIGAGGGVGTGGANGLGGTGSGSGGSLGGDGSSPTVLPTPKGTCAPFTTGDMMFNGQKFKVWAGAPAHGPLVIYWYATFSSVAEVTAGLGQAAIDEITSQGGVVAAMYTTTSTGTNTGDNVWYTGDFDYADEVVACAIQEQHIDTRQIHSIGFSAGGLQTGYMAYARSNYIASVVTYSGGSLSNTLQDPSNVPSIMCQHGTTGQDVVVLDFSNTSHAIESDIQSKGGFAIDCDHGGGHMIPAADVASSWHFMKDHPYKVKPEPYAGGIPAGFPSYCKIP